MAAVARGSSGATMLADYGEKIGLAFPRPPEATAAVLRRQLPETAAVSNNLAPIGRLSSTGWNGLRTSWPGLQRRRRNRDQSTVSRISAADVLMQIDSPASQPYRITNGFVIGSSEVLIHTVLGRV